MLSPVVSPSARCGASPKAAGVADDDAEFENWLSNA
jgi:hypothetical protein